MKTKITFVVCCEKVEEKLISSLPKSWEVMRAKPDNYLALIREEHSDAVIVYFDKGTVGVAGEVIEKTVDGFSYLPVVCLTTFVNMDTAVEMMKKGAGDYFHVPIDSDRLKRTVENAVKIYQLSHKVSLLESQAGGQGRFANMVGASPQMQDVFRMIQMVAKSNATVLVLGESGTGKELVAKAIHNLSERGKKRFIDINCGAIPKELLENELFGHERGAYTGADRQYLGSCERAEGGTLFLDEISEMDPSLQVKLLRVLQERSFSRVGGTSKIVVDVRFVAATNKDIKAEVDRGSFREDLFYRLNVVPITIPPLRARPEDVPMLARHFLKIYSEKNHKEFGEFTSEALDSLVSYNWPGNVRELENVIERLVVLHSDTKVRPAYLPRFVRQSGDRKKPNGAPYAPLELTTEIIPLELVEKYAIESAVNNCNGDVQMAAKKLKIGQATLYRKLRRYGIK